MTAAAEPSAYELDAWQNVQRYRSRPLSRAVRSAGEGVVKGVEAAGRKTAEFLDEHPNVDAVVGRSRDIAVKGAKAVGTAAEKAAKALPDGVTDWTSAAVDSVRRTGGRVSRAGLSSKRVVALHQKRGHAVERLSDLRRLDLEQVHKVRGQALSWYYPAIAAASGVGTGLMITGGQVVLVASAGASAAPSAGTVIGALALDATAILALASRAVGHVSLLYGYDPEEPAEKLFVLSVVNAGSAVSASAKTAAMADISRLTQALVRGKSWEVLNHSLVSRVTNQFTKMFGTRLTKNGLGKIVPAVGIVLGSAFNWATIESIVDAAEMAYRRRWLLEKYPQLADGEDPITLTVVESEGADDPDEVISVLDQIAEAGGPDLRDPDQVA